MFRKAVERLIPSATRRRVIPMLPDPVYRFLRSRYYGPSLRQRLYLPFAVRALGARHRDLVESHADVQVRVVGSSAMVCRDLDVASVDAIRQRHLDMVTELFDREGVHYFVVPAGSHLRHCVGVLASDRNAIVSAVLRDLAKDPVYLSLPTSLSSWARHTLVADADRATLLSLPTFRVSQIYVSACGNLVIGTAHGCDIEFWVEDEQRALLAPRPNGVATVLGPDDRRPARTTVRDRTYRTVEPFAHPALAEIRFPIDVVYTWVDGQDPKWQTKKDRCLRVAGRSPMNWQAANSSRFLSRDELRYSLRSLSLYADWVRTVYIVTDDQVPIWLDTSHPRIRMVSHREIFRTPQVLPTFNSHSIESQLHHIEGLSQRYLYLNDDVFFGRPVAPELFFVGNGLSKFFLSKAQIELGSADVDDVPVTSAAKNNRELLLGDYGRLLTQKLKHVPHSQRRDVLSELEQRYPEEFSRTASNRFRSHEDISVASALHHHFAYLTGRAVPGEIRYM
jgi:hypothetical protein